MKAIVAMASAAALLASASQAEIPPSERIHQVTVSYADLDLGQAAGRATLERRIATAVRRICPRAAPANLREMQIRRECSQEAWAGARSQLVAIYGSNRLAQATVQVGGKAD